MPPRVDITKIYSFSVTQYCQPEDLHYYVELQAKLLQDNRGGVIGHFDVPDVDKAKLYYKNFSKETVEKYRSKIRSIFAEGSYWHDMERFLLIGQRLGLKVEIRDTNCYYRSDIIIHVD